MFFYIFASKVTAGSSASGTASAKSSEAAAATAVVSTAIASTASTASHQAAQNEEDEPSVAGLDQEDEHQQNDSAADEKLAEGDVNGLVGLLAMVVVLLGGHGERDASVGGDDLGELLDAQGDGGVVVTLLGKGDMARPMSPTLASLRMPSRP